MKKIRITLTLFLLTAALLLSGCSKQQDVSDQDDSISSDISESNLSDNSTSASVEDSESADISSDEEEIKIHCFIENEDKLAFNIAFDIHEDSIQYIDIDEEIFGVDRFLDESALRFDIIFTVKDEFKEKYKDFKYNKCTYTVHDAPTNKTLVNKTLSCDEALILPDCSVDNKLNFTFTRISEYGYKAQYNGVIYISSDWDYYYDDYITITVYYMLLAS